MTRPVSELRGPVRALFSDVDGTMTTGERIDAATYVAIERLSDAGIPVIVVTGRPAGFGFAFERSLIASPRRPPGLRQPPQASLEPENRKWAQQDSNL